MADISDTIDLIREITMGRQGDGKLMSAMIEDLNVDEPELRAAIRQEIASFLEYPGVRSHPLEFNLYAFAAHWFLIGLCYERARQLQ